MAGEPLLVPEAAAAEEEPSPAQDSVTRGGFFQHSSIESTRPGVPRVGYLPAGESFWCASGASCLGPVLVVFCLNLPHSSRIFECIIGHRLSPKGRAILTFSWKPSQRAVSDIVGEDVPVRIEVANLVLKAAKRLNLEVMDGRSATKGLEYYNDIEHLLEDGVLPAWVGDEATDLDGKQRRFYCYRKFAAIAKSKILLLYTQLVCGCDVCWLVLRV